MEEKKENILVKLSGFEVMGIVITKLVVQIDATHILVVHLYSSWKLTSLVEPSFIFLLTLVIESG